jgi:hypothetical protein
MKRLIALAAVVSLMLAVGAFAAGNHEGHSHSKSDSKPAATASAASGAAKGGSWTGEILDAGCYLGRGAMGPKHAECALKCASQGMPMMLLTKDGKAVLLTPNHDNPDAYESLKKMAGSVATVTGTLSERGGVRGIDVTGAKAEAAATN